MVERVSDRLAETSSDPNFGRREVSTLCKRVVNQMADLIDSQQLVPTTAKEAAEIAKVFANIAQQDRVAKSLTKMANSGNTNAIETTIGFSGLPASTQQAVLDVVSRFRATQPPVVPGRVQQTVGLEDDL